MSLLTNFRAQGLMERLVANDGQPPGPPALKVEEALKSLGPGALDRVAAALYTADRQLQPVLVDILTSPVRDLRPSDTEP